MSEKNPWKTLSIKEVYNNPWIQVTHREVLNPSGGEGIYGVVHYKNLAIGVIPLDQDLNTWIVGQYRYTLEEYHWEIPEGGGSHGVEPVESAKRELLEETGIQAGKWTKVLDIHLSNSVTDEAGMAFVAQDLTFGEAQPEETEELEIRKIPFSELFDMVMDGRITDSLSMVAVLKVQAMLDRGLL